VIPKQVAARNLLEVDGATLAQLMAVVQRLSKLLVEELQPDGVQIAQFNGAPAGQTVFHLHLHIIPRFAGDSLGIHASQQADAEQLKALQARLQKRLEQ
jgi:histidine triad (HIT) family protein